ncbi:hypothetical protein CQ012_02420 [Arthrobacter sp. MYb214]|uniref:hypothetical protein n=1 Tax=Arthrobacter sp. MYb214 TaxID=1848596 RepID=UPI000CFA94AF|nr:hypothetical protein [Arthrobacter sp. MYb214]PRB78263.1 hypothetical protein CQ012_02420 [Arthrobacter sp. MYb214]
MTDQPPLNPDALEAGAKALFLRERKYHTPSIECPEPPNWEDLTETSMEHYRGNARAVLAVAQPVVNSVEGIPAQVQVISWEEEPEHECWKLAPDETFVGLIVKSDRAWSPADKYTLNIQRPEVDDA